MFTVRILFGKPENLICLFAALLNVQDSFN